MDPGFDTGRGGGVPVDLSFGQYDEANGRSFLRRIHGEVEALPGVESGSVALDLPLGQLHIRSRLETDDLDLPESDRMFLNQRARRRTASSRTPSRTPPLDPAVLGGVTAIMVAATVGTCYVPARAAGRVDPVVTLRTE